MCAHPTGEVRIIGSMAISLQAGTVVRLKSGGPDMTVVEEEHIFGKGTSRVRCQWFEERKLMQGTFPEESLRIVKDDTAATNAMG